MFLACSMLSLTGMAQAVSLLDAARVARNVLYLQQADDAVRPLTSFKPLLQSTLRADDADIMYVFTEAQGGYVVVSAWGGVPPVLAYSLKGSWSEAAQPPAVQHLINDYREQIRSARTRGLAATPAVQQTWQQLLAETPSKMNGAKSISPMLLTTWDQGRYYNAMCPSDPDGPDDHAVNGCVPTALAQIMNYFRWPVQGTGSYSYTEPDYGILSADFGNTVYRWNEMPLELSAYNDPVAELMFHLGVSVDLDYGPDGSGMYNHKAAWAMRTYFGYDPATEYIFRDTAVHSNWKQLVLQHLDAGIPLYYAGWSDTINEMGHAFVCDGYQDTTWFHMNFGWGGSYDGYFMLDDLTPGVSDFTLDHELILNMKPAAGYPLYCGGNDTLVAMNGVVEDGSGPMYNYANGLDCYWLIAPEDSVSNIKLTFKKFNVSATGDILYVYNGPTTSHPLVGSYTGTTLPAALNLANQQVLLYFHSSASGNAAGWMVEYETTLPVYCTTLQTVTADAGIIVDGSGPRDYHNNSMCRWKIEPNGATSVTAQTTAMDLAPGDTLYFYDSNNGLLLAKVSSDSMLSGVVSPSGKMTLLFRSDANTAAGGWAVQYNSAGAVPEPECLTELSLTPNPARDQLFLSAYAVRSGELCLQLLNASLQQVYTKREAVQPGLFSLQIPLSDLPSGLYLLRITAGEEQSVHKIVIAK